MALAGQVLASAAGQVLASAAGPRPVLLVTDVGRDVDDTLALAATNGLRRAGELDLVGVIATGGAGETRARVVRGWLRRFGLGDAAVPVAASLAEGRPQCAVPEGTPALEEAALYQGTAEELLLELADRHAGALEVFAIAPLSPIAAALEGGEGLERLRKGLRALYVQGQCRVEAGRLAPDFAAFNLEEDREASEAVFAKLQDAVPFRLLGKHAAYQVSMLRGDFASWDGLLGSDEMTQGAKLNMDIFRRENPERFYELYPIPEQYRNDEEWFDHMEALSHPYDPLLLLSAFRPSLFKQLPCDVSDASQEHLTIGNSEDTPGVLDAAAARAALSELIGEGVRSMAAGE